MGYVQPNKPGGDKRKKVKRGRRGGGEEGRRGGGEEGKRGGEEGRGAAEERRAAGGEYPEEKRMKGWRREDIHD